MTSKVADTDGFFDFQTEFQKGAKLTGKFQSRWTSIKGHGGFKIIVLSLR